MSTTCAFLVTFLLATTASGARAAAAPRACARSGAGRATRELRACCIAADNGSGERSVSARCTGLVGRAWLCSAAGWPLTATSNATYVYRTGVQAYAPNPRRLRPPSSASSTMQLHALSCGAAPRATPRAAAPLRRRGSCARTSPRGAVVCAATAPAANRLSAAFAAALARKQCVPARYQLSRRACVASSCRLRRAGCASQAGTDPVHLRGRSQPCDHCVGAACA